MVKDGYPLEWVNVTDGKIPPPAFVGGRDHACELYVGRVQHNNELLPGKINPQYKSCYVASEGKEHTYSEYQVLCGTFLKWVSSSGNKIPSNAVQGGHAANGEALYIGRASTMGTLAVGKVHPSHGACYIPYGGKEYVFQNYEILIYSYT